MGIVAKNNIVDAKDFKENISNGQGLFIVDFFATWCMPCKMLAPVLQIMEEKYSNIKFVKVDIDECQDLAQEYSIMSVPTLLFFRSGELVGREVGFKSEADLDEIIRNVFGDFIEESPKNVESNTYSK